MVGWNYRAGTVISFSTLGGVNEMTDPNYSQLFTNAVQLAESPSLYSNVTTLTDGTATLNITGPSSFLNGNQYQAVFSNAAGSVTTTPAVLTVDYAPEVVTNPTSLTVNAGGTAVLTAVVNASPADQRAVAGQYGRRLDLPERSRWTTILQRHVGPCAGRPLWISAALI